MEGTSRKRTAVAAGLVMAMSLLAGGCADRAAQSAVRPEETEEAEQTAYLTVIDVDGDTVDPQCTSGYYTVALNTFDRLIENRVNEDGSTELVPSLADSWEVSGDGLTYTFHLHEGVRYSNGEPLTAEDVRYTFLRMLTNPEAVNQDLYSMILGAEDVMEGRAESLAGVEIQDSLTFTVTLAYPYGPFLACLSTPGASILDETTTIEAGEDFGVEPGQTIGTGPFLLEDWQPGERMLLRANPDCWSGAPGCAGVDIRMVSDSESQRILFEEGELDILDLDNMSDDAEYFIRGDIYQELLVHGPRVGATYIALNASVKPLGDVRVRRALQLALDRKGILAAVCGGRGKLENGIFPHGLIGYNPELEEIPYDLEQAKALLAEAGYESGFYLEISVSDSASSEVHEILELAASMWRRLGMRVELRELEDEVYIQRRRAGELACCALSWSADFNDPDNFIYTFFGNEQNTRLRGLCYQDEAVIGRVEAARAITDEKARLAEYRGLERKIVQEDAAWIPLYSKEHYFVVRSGVEGFTVPWNGWSNTSYRGVSLQAKD